MNWYGVALFASVAGTVSAVSAEQNLYVAPFEVLEDYPLCDGAGKIAYRVVFDARQVKARFGIADVEQPTLCSIKQRSGVETREIPIPCPDSEPDYATQALLRDLPRAVDISGEIIGCISTTSHEFVAANWQISAQTSQGPYEDKGDLSSPSLVMSFGGPSTVETDGPRDEQNGKPAMLGFLINRLKVTNPFADDVRLDITTYLVMSPYRYSQTVCPYPAEPTSCRTYTPSAKWLMWELGSNDPINFVEEE
jgi:hypothetical protein